jgi:hypothetical protein
METMFHGDLLPLWLFLMKAFLENFWNVKSLDVKVFPPQQLSHDAMSPKQLGS